MNQRIVRNVQLSALQYLRASVTLDYRLYSGWPALPSWPCIVDVSLLCPVLSRNRSIQDGAAIASLTGPTPSLAIFRPSR